MKRLLFTLYVSAFDSVKLQYLFCVQLLDLMFPSQLKLWKIIRLSLSVNFLNALSVFVRYLSYVYPFLPWSKFRPRSFISL